MDKKRLEYLGKAIGVIIFQRAENNEFGYACPYCCTYAGKRNKLCEVPELECPDMIDRHCNYYRKSRSLYRINPNGIDMKEWAKNAKGRIVKERERLEKSLIHKLTHRN